ncbi:FtsQ-type POTRA domain-containing protein [Streptomyces sp. RKND-216]|uniref:cell division protein FtsQ/DivIB n=1 Tax=Streptomyces sp. RKND-216 TaxID=2562581 RepID=UPI00109E2598|nr:FtsQ-type POTRA domain-containing protein [Streptomyces sp. RKND-216]THA26875.1 FtsQ-type POTRA domain-containing protein [Streptomyces sp. RKND-216]
MAGPAQAAERHTDERRTGEDPAAAPAEPSVRRRLPRPGRRALLVLVVLALLLGAFGVWALYGSSWLRVEKVSVDGTRVLTERRVLDAADVPLGAPLASLDATAVERRVRETLRRVDEVRVVRAWPHGVGVHVTERRPVLLLRKDGGDTGEGARYVEVDAEGVRFATVGEAPEGVPFLAVEPRADAQAQQRFSARALRRAAADVLAGLPAGVREDARTVRAASYDALTVELTGARTVRWGSAERGTAKNRALRALMKASPDAAHFDVSAPTAPAASPSRPSPP